MEQIGDGRRFATCRNGDKLGEWLGGGLLLLVRHKGREDLVRPVTMKCPACGARWWNPALGPVDDASAAALLAEVRAALVAEGKEPKAA